MQTQGQVLQPKVSPIFQKNWLSKKPIIINRGGTSSTKTGSILRLCLNFLIVGKIDDNMEFEKGTLSIVRKFSASLRTSVQKDFEDILSEYNLWGIISVNKTEKTYKYMNRTIEFIGVDDPQKARWPRRDILYCNEANELNPEDFFQLQIRTNYKVFIDFNPSDEDVWINTELEQRRALEEWDVDVIVSTYKDNPFLNPRIRNEIERLSNKNPSYYKIYGLGQYGKLEWVIFSFTEIDSVPPEAKLLGYGQDFGYTNDPSALVGVYQWNDAIILHEEFYETGLTNRNIAEKYKGIGIDRYTEIYADSSEPKSIDEIHEYGFNIKPVEKWPDSIKFGIDCMLQFPIIVTSPSVNLKKELRKYTWATDKNGKALQHPIDMWNHAIDAARYFFMMRLRKPKTVEIFVGSF